MLTQNRLKFLFTYNSDTGLFIRNISIKGKKLNSKVGAVTFKGYLAICVDGKQNLAHRLAFLYMTGKMPENVVDHINGNKLDNRWSNLRDVKNFENLRNSGAKKNNKLGEKGITQSKDGFSVQIRIGTYKTLKEAIEVRNKMFKLIHGEHTHSSIS